MDGIGTLSFTLVAHSVRAGHATYFAAYCWRYTHLVFGVGQVGLVLREATVGGRVAEREKLVPGRAWHEPPHARQPRDDTTECDLRFR